MTFDAASFLATLTTKPGVYQMFDSSDAILYVGKAKNLRNRVKSYFRASGLQAKTMALVAKISRIEVNVTKSETEALLLEQSLIKKLRPPYNIILRDDKSYPYIYISDHKKFPQLLFHRGKKNKLGKYFGPYPSASSVRESIHSLQKLFQLRDCKDSFFNNRSRPCLQHQIGRCLGPCSKGMDPEQYGEAVQLAIMFLNGKSSKVLKAFQKNMEKASANLEFELAAQWRDRLSQLQKVQEQQYVHRSSGDVDVFALAEQEGKAVVQGLFVRTGRVLGQKSFQLENQLSLGSDQLMLEFLSQYFLAQDEVDCPEKIVVSHGSEDTGPLISAIEERYSRKLSILGKVRSERARWLAMAVENAELNLASHLQKRAHQRAKLLDLQETLRLDAPPMRIECFDISHSSGEATVASCVVFEAGQAANSYYRRFNISGEQAGDDYGALRQALTRRYQRIKDGEESHPDLLLIDGGKGQLSVAHSVLQELGIDSVKIMGISKGPARRAGHERYFVEGQEISIKGGSLASHLLQQLRDEAHRFAITGHRQRRGRARNRSDLEDIPGIGSKKRKELLLHFGSAKGIKGASQEELLKVPGISKKLAREVYNRVN